MEEQEKKCDCAPHKIFGVALLGGLLAGLAFYVFEELDEAKKKTIKDTVVKNIKAYLRKWVEE